MSNPFPLLPSASTLYRLHARQSQEAKRRLIKVGTFPLLIMKQLIRKGFSLFRIGLNGLSLMNATHRVLGENYRTTLEELEWMDSQRPLSSMPLRAARCVLGHQRGFMRRHAVLLMASVNTFDPIHSMADVLRNVFFAPRLALFQENPSGLQPWERLMLNFELEELKDDEAPVEEYHVPPLANATRRRLNFELGVLRPYPRSCRQRLSHRDE